MTNRDYARTFNDETHSSYIDKLFWIAGSLESSEFDDFLSDLEEETWQEFLPDIFNSNNFTEYLENNEMLEVLKDFEKFGFIARVHHPKHYDFRFNKDGRFESCSVRMSNCRISVIYADTIKELVDKVKSKSEEVFQDYIIRDKPLNYKR